MRNPFASIHAVFRRQLSAPPAAYAATFIAVLAFAPLVVGLALVAAGRQPWTGIAAGLPLGGYSDRLKPLQFGWWDRSFQNSISARIDGHLPLRNWMLRIGNEFDYRVLRTSRMSKDEIIIGRGGALFTMTYVAEAFGYRPDIPDAYLHDVAGKLKRLHALLAQRGVSLMVIGTPSKLSVARDAVPSRFRDFRPGAPRNYDRMAKIFTERGVPFVDGRAELLNSEFNGREPLFPRGGLHWNVLGAYTTVRPLVARLLAERSPDAASRLVLDAFTFVRPPARADQDLLAILNLLFPDRSYSSPRLTTRLEGKPLPKGIVMVGTSFLGAIIEVMEQSAIASRIAETPYMTMVRHCVTCGWEKMSDDWAQRLLTDSSALVVEINEAASFGSNEIGYLTDIFDRLLPVLEKPDAARATR
jgi:hypothetical protein